MKTRESGMPDEATWAGFFSPARVLGDLGLTESFDDVVDFGCGYGTFAIQAAQIVGGTVYALDIDEAMVTATTRKAEAAGLTNVCARQRDFVAHGTGLGDASVDYAMLFNLLHCEDPLSLLRDARRVLRPGGLLGIMHWNPDPTTPRGPSLAIRPRPAQCRDWAERVGFRLHGPGRIDLPPYHFGLLMQRGGEA